MDRSFLDILETPLGTLCVYFRYQEGPKIYRITFGCERRGELKSLPERIRGQFFEYFHCERTNFDLPLDIRGTEFDRRVWKMLLKVPYGEKRSYRWLAEAVGSPGASRAVGGALRRNPLPIVIPCHRIVRADGGLGGYSAGVQIKRSLLELEARCKSIFQYRTDRISC